MMARLVVKSPYFKGGGGASGYLEYIGTRERVEIIPDSRPPTRRQEQLIQNILRDFPDSRQLREYESYEAAHTKHTASAFISTALEVNKPAVSQSEVYMKYIATRPRAERIGDHGLFGDEDHVDLEKAMAEIENYPGNVWGHIISLQRGDAARLGDRRDEDGPQAPSEDAGETHRYGPQAGLPGTGHVDVKTTLVMCCILGLVFLHVCPLILLDLRPPFRYCVVCKKPHKEVTK